jgi:hypothetical protein
MANGWIGLLLSAYAAFTLVRLLWKWLRDRLNPHPRIRVRRRNA